MGKSLKQITEELAEKSKLLHQVFEEAGPDLDFTKVKCLEGDTAAKVEKVRQMNKELEDLGKERDQLMELENARKKAEEIHDHYNQPGPMTFPGKSDTRGDQKDLGQLFVESPAFKQKNVVANLDINLKTLFETGAGWAPESTRIGRVELYPTRPLVVADFLPILNTQQAAIKYMEETTFTNAAAEVAEGGGVSEYGEAALQLTERSVTVEKVAVWLPVTDEQLEDVESARDYVNSRLTYMLRQRLDGQILNGDGATPNLLGTLNVTGIQSQAKGTDPTPDAIYKLFTLIRSDGYAEPSVLFINPTDWQEIRLLRTADGIYIFGNPSEAGPERIWGVQAVQTTALTAGTAVAGDYANFAALYMRRGIEIQVTNAHSDYFIKGKLAIRADMRCAVVHFRPKAFGKVTGI